MCKKYYISEEGVVINTKNITGNIFLDACLSKLILLNLNLKKASIEDIKLKLKEQFLADYSYSTIYKALYYGLGINRENLHLI